MTNEQLDVKKTNQFKSKIWEYKENNRKAKRIINI